MGATSSPRQVNSTQRLRSLTRVAAVSALLAAGLAPSAARADADAPGVARVSAIYGSADIKRADSGDTVAATVNAPLNVGDYLTTAGDSRAELQFDLGNAVRLAERTQTRAAQFDRDGDVLQVAQGTVELAVVRRTSARPAIQTPALTVRPSQRGQYRVTVDGDGNSEITVRTGRADISWAGGSQVLSGGSTLVSRGRGNDVSVQTVDPIANDSFDRWNNDRDRYLARAFDSDYASSDIAGLADLDAGGRWIDDPSYGRVWSPAVASDWAPYRDGRWAWEPYYGWTWVSYEPWGWAPYHYGRWFYANNAGWCWYPGAAYVRPFYSPALVGFIGFGSPGFGISIGFGNLGWVPLAPYESYRPWWGPHYGNQTIVNNTTNIVNNVTNNYYNNTNPPAAPVTVGINRVYRNVNVPGAVTGVNAGAFGNRRYTMTAVTATNLRNARPVFGALPVVPTRESHRYTERGATVANVPAPSTFRALPAVTVHQPTFETQREAVRAISTPKNVTPALAAPSVAAPTLAAPARRTIESRVPVTAPNSPSRRVEPETPWNRFSNTGNVTARAPATIPQRDALPSAAAENGRSHGSTAPAPVARRYPSNSSTVVHQAPAPRSVQPEVQRSAPRAVQPVQHAGHGQRSPN